MKQINKHKKPSRVSNFFIATCVLYLPPKHGAFIPIPSVRRLQSSQEIDQKIIHTRNSTEKNCHSGLVLLLFREILTKTRLQSLSTLTKQPKTSTVENRPIMHCKLSIEYVHHVCQETVSLSMPYWFKLQNGYFDNKYFWNWSDECCWRYIHNWIYINVSTFLGFFVRYFGKLHLDILNEFLLVYERIFTT